MVENIAEREINYRESKEACGSPGKISHKQEPNLEAWTSFGGSRKKKGSNKTMKAWIVYRGFGCYEVRNE
jgi:hypothetical protein